MTTIPVKVRENEPSLDIPLLAFWGVYFIGILSGAAVALMVVLA